MPPYVDHVVEMNHPRHGSLRITYITDEATGEQRVRIAEWRNNRWCFIPTRRAIYDELTSGELVNV